MPTAKPEPQRPKPQVDNTPTTPATAGLNSTVPSSSAKPMKPDAVRHKVPKIGKNRSCDVQQKDPPYRPTGKLGIIFSLS